MPTLFKHQKNAVDRFINNNYIHAFFHDVGVGKTLSALTSYKELLKKNKAKLLVICPKSLIETSWSDDIKKFTSFEYINWNKENKYKDTDIYLINPESFITKNKQGLIKELTDKNDVMVVIDESQKMKNYRSKTTKTLLSLRDKFKYKIIMSATPAPNDESEYWAQMCFLDDYIFGSNFFKFRYYYFQLARGNAMLDLNSLRSCDTHALIKKGFRFIIKDSMRKSFYKRMEKTVDFVRKEDVFDLPDQIDVIRKVSLSTQLKKIYKSMEKNLRAEFKEKDIVAVNALSKLTRLRQIISGFSKADDGTFVRYESSPKLSELKDILEEIGNKQVYIFAEYHEEIDQIAFMLNNKKVSVLDGRTEDKDKVIKDFQQNKTQYLIAHPQSGGVGLSFNNCDYCIFYSLSYSSENYFQCRGRIHRANKKNNATYIHLIAENTIDEIILDVVKTKKKTMDLIGKFING